MESDGLLKKISEVTELNAINEFLQDEDVTTALMRLVNLLARPDVPANVAPALIVELQALATKFSIQAKYYMTIGKGAEGATARKNIYFSLAEELSALSNALKYQAR